jgi:hypothetical protein
MPGIFAVAAGPLSTIKLTGRAGLRWTWPISFPARRYSANLTCRLDIWGLSSRFVGQAPNTRPAAGGRGANMEARRCFAIQLFNLRAGGNESRLAEYHDSLRSV